MECKYSDENNNCASYKSQYRIENLKINLCWKYNSFEIIFSNGHKALS